MELLVSQVVKALTEPTDIQQTFMGWDASKGRTPRHEMLCARIRANVSTIKFDEDIKAIMRFQSWWRLRDPVTQKGLEKLAKKILQWNDWHRNGDAQWWALTKREYLTLREARRLGVENIPVDAKLVKNPWYGNTDKPNCHSDYRIFVIGESPTAHAFGISLEMETLAQWAANITEAGQKILQAGKTTKQHQNSLRRKLEGLFEIIKEYPKETPRWIEINDELMIADDIVRRCDILLIAATPGGRPT